MIEISAAGVAKFILGWAVGSCVGRWFFDHFGSGWGSLLAAMGVSLAAWLVLLWMLQQ